MGSRRGEPATQPGGLRDICNAAGGSMKSSLNMFGKKRKAAKLAAAQAEAMERIMPMTLLRAFEAAPGTILVRFGKDIQYGKYEQLKTEFVSDSGAFDVAKFNDQINKQYKFAGGKTMLHIAIEYMHSPDRGLRVSGKAAALSIYNLFEAAKEAGAGPIDIFNQADDNGDTPLHYAARLMALFPRAEKDQPLAKFLTTLFELHKAGLIKLKPSAKNNRGMTPMFLAEMLGNELAIKIFTQNDITQASAGMKPNMVTAPALKSDGDAGYDMYKVQSYGKTVTGWSIKQGGGAPAPNKIGFGDEC